MKDRSDLNLLNHEDRQTCWKQSNACVIILLNRVPVESVRNPEETVKSVLMDSDNSQST